MINKNMLDFVGSIKPIITEKALKCSENSYVVFKAPTNASKNVVKKAVEFLYKDVKVTRINVALIKGKVKKFKGKIGKRADYKKFFVKLDKAIDITTGIK